MAHPQAVPLSSMPNGEGHRRHLKRLSLSSSSAYSSAAPQRPRYQPRDSELMDMSESSSSKLDSPRAGPPPVRPRHARRQSSISYRSSGPPLLSPTFHSPQPSPVSSRFSESTSTPRIQEEPEPEQPPPSPRPGDVMITGTTLVHQHGQLLSFIAQKERRCLDLREELKKQETELAKLKAKWEGVVARELSSARTPMRTSSAHPSPNPSVRSPITSPALGSTPVRRPSTVEAERTPTGSPQPQPEPSSSAKKWIGGMLKSASAGVDRVMETLSAPIEPMPPPSPTPMRTLPSEERPLTMPDSPASSAGSRRPNSTSSLTTDESALFEKHASRTSSMSSMDAMETSSDTLKQGATTPSADMSRTPTGEADQSSWLAQAEEAEKRFRDQNQAKHARRRSTFEVIGQAAWSGLGKRWGDMAASETYAKTRRATVEFCDNLEKTLAEAINIDAEVQKPSPLSPKGVSSPRVLSPRLNSPSTTSAFFGRQQPQGLGLDSLAEEEEEPAVPPKSAAMSRGRSKGSAQSRQNSSQGIQA